MASQNLGSVNYMLSINKEESKKKESRMKGIEENIRKEENSFSTISKKASTRGHKFDCRYKHKQELRTSKNLNTVYYQEKTQQTEPISKDKELLILEENLTEVIREKNLKKVKNFYKKI